MIEILIISLILVGFAVAALGISLLLDRKAEFRGGNCHSGSGSLEEHGISCGCGGNCSGEKSV